MGRFLAAAKKIEAVLDIANDLANNHGEKLKRWFSRGIVMSLFPIISFLICIILSMGAAHAMNDLLQQTWDTLDRTLFGEYISDETTFEEYCDMPEVLAKSLTFDRFDLSDSGYFLVTEDDLLMILNAVIEYEAQAKHFCDVQTKYYHHWFDYTINEVETTPTSSKTVKKTRKYIIDHGLSKEAYDSYRVESMETTNEYVINWQEVYAMCVLASADETTKDWEDMYEEVDTDDDGVMDDYRIKPIARIDSQKLDQIIEKMKFQFSYWHDASKGNQGGHPSYAQNYEYDDMENYAYEEFEGGIEGHVGCSGSALLDVACSPENVFDYTHKKLPRTAPNYAQNVFKTVLWYYNETTKVMECKRTYADPQTFIDFGNEICGKENFDFDWYVEMVDIIPGGTLPDGTDRFQDLHNLYDAYKLGAVIDKYDYMADGVGRVKLGSNIGYIAPGSGSGNYIYNYDGDGIMNLPNSISDSDIEAYARKSLRISDNLTLEQVSQLLNAVCPGTAIYGGRAGFIKFQEEYGCSIIGVVAIMMYESGHGRSNKAQNLWNFSGMKAYSGDPYSVNGWHSFKAQVEAEYPNLSMEEKQAMAVFLQCKRVYDSHINRDNGADARDNYYEFNEHAPVYCGDAALTPEGIQWINTVSRMRKQYEMVLNLATTDYSGIDGGGTSVAGSGKGVDICNFALQFVGNPYVWGGTSLTNGADCSGFTQAVFAHFGISIPRTSVGQRTAGVEVTDRTALSPGDLICYNATSTNANSHVAIYIGNGKIVHAASRTSGIKVSNAFYRPVITIRRLV